jgi:hypothetical protein
MPVAVVVVYMPVHLVRVEQVEVGLQEILELMEQLILVVVEVVVLFQHQVQVAVVDQV